MSSRRSRRLWPWLLVAAFVGGAVYFISRASDVGLPIPGRSPSAPREKITEGDRRKLERILEERSSPD
jgi:hypothetical protein